MGLNVKREFMAYCDTSGCGLSYPGNPIEVEHLVSQGCTPLEMQDELMNIINADTTNNWYVYIDEFTGVYTVCCPTHTPVL